MSDIPYPPTRTVTLGAALESVEADLREVETDLDGQLPEDADSVADVDSLDERAIREAVQRRRRLDNQRDALEWAIDQWDDDAEIRLQALTAATRARVQDAIRNRTVGDRGQVELGDWLTAATIQDAPWLADGADIVDRATTTGQLPPALMDWLTAETDDLNDLTEGN